MKKKVVVFSVIGSALLIATIILVVHLIRAQREWPRESTFIDLINAGGIYTYVIIFLGMAMLLMAVVDFISLRRRKITSAEFAGDLKDFLKNKNYDKALIACGNNSFYLSKVFKQALVTMPNEAEKTQDFIKATNTNTEKLILKLQHKSYKYLAISIIALILGLLGAIIGVRITLNIIAIKLNPSPADLAKGIELTLVSTPAASIVLMIGLLCYFFIRRRITYYILELKFICDYLTSKLKKN